MAILIDTSYLFAHIFAKDANHLRAKTSAALLVREVRVVPAPVLVELFYLAKERLDYDKAIRILTSVHASYQIEPLSEASMKRMEEIMVQYRTARFDYVDTAIMALAEHLDITKLATFDRRDYPIFRPKHCNALELFP